MQATNARAYSRRALVALVAVLVTSCTYWEPYPRPTPAAPPSHLPRVLRVATDTAPVLLNAPFVRADTLFGRRAGDTVGIALSALRGLERPRVHALRSVALVIGATAGWVTLGLLAGGLE
jgi:hypothetical protein